jgi:inward rectifier potassium channel
MAFKRVNKQIESEINTGFGTSSTNNAGRFYNRDGRPNVAKRGMNFLNRFSWYHTMLALPAGKFLLVIFSIYIFTNLIFAGIYYLIGIEHLNGIMTGSGWKNFSEVFFFSTQTFTTVGYGRISPTGFLTSSIATLEAFLGLLSFAIATGLFYGRFSKPQAFLKFSHNALISPYKDGVALMFRMAPYKNNNLSDVEVKLTLAMRIEENGAMANKFYPLDIEISKLNSLVLSWTIVHAINEKSPLLDMTLEDMKSENVEILVFVKAFDDVFSNTVVTRTSYVADEIIWGAKFKIMYFQNPDKTKTILDLNMINVYDKVDLLQTVNAATQPVSG